MRLTLFTIQYMSIVALFVECWLVFRKMRGELHACIFLSSVATLVNNVGYLMQMRAVTEEASINALQTAYLGKVWIPYSLFLFGMMLCKINVPKVIRALLSLVHFVTFLLMLLVKHNEWYYKNIRYVHTGIFPQIVHESGPWHVFYDALLAFYIVCAMAQMVRAWHRETNPVVKGRLRMVTFAFLAFIIFFALYKLNKSWSYDVTSLGYTIGTAFMYVAIFRYDLLDTGELAREYVVDELSAGIVAVDEQGTVGYYNKPALALFPSLETDAQNVAETLRGAIDRREPLRFGERIYKPVANTISRRGSTGTIYILEDETEHIRYVEQLEEQTRRADSASKAKSAFLANMSHEIRTPINAILGMDEMILREGEQPDIVSYAEDIRSAGKTLLSIINDILDLTKIEEGRMEILPAQYDLSSLVNDLSNMTQQRADNKGLRFEVHLDESIPCRLVGDEIRLRQCVLNILTNAVKYTEKGSVTLNVSYEKTGENSIALRFSVSDTGIGMKEEDMSRLFAPFARIEERRNRYIEGTGLGMSITKQLLSLMGSSLEVSSTYGEGSTFSFTVSQPVVQWEPIGKLADHIRSNEMHEEYRSLFQAQDAHILVVDDMPVNLHVIRSLLKKTCVQVDTALSGREALEMAARQNYDAIFIDHMMPEMDGIETLHELHGMPGMKDIPCIALTANAISGSREMYLEEGFSDYLSKPVSGEKLEEMLQHYLPAEKVHKPGPEAAPDVLPVEIPGWLSAVKGLDTRRGLCFCGSAKAYLETLEIYAHNAAESADEIERCRDAGDIKNVVLKLHALKSTSRAIGAEELGALAEKLELAGKADDRQTVFTELEEMLARFRALGAALAPMCGDCKTETRAHPLITDADLEKAYGLIRKYVTEYDSEGVESVIGNLEDFCLPDAERERIDALRSAAANFDWDKAAEMLL